MERIQQDPRLTANRSKSVNSSIAEAGAVWGYVGHNAAQGVDNPDTSSCGAGAPARVSARCNTSADHNNRRSREIVDRVFVAVLF